jgi:hypothetical protein
VILQILISDLLTNNINFLNQPFTIEEKRRVLLKIYEIPTELRAETIRKMTQNISGEKAVEIERCMSQLFKIIDEEKSKFSSYVKYN